MENTTRSEVLICVSPQQVVQEIVMQLQQFTLQEGSHFDWLLMHAFSDSCTFTGESKFRPGTELSLLLWVM